MHERRSAWQATSWLYPPNLLAALQRFETKGNRLRMKAEKMREWADNELNAKTREFSEQLFRLRFQLRNGQTDILVKIRELRKDIARAKTLQRERELR
ncbi:MAG: 50S ribosomal protein L29 [Terriglobia bacterium]